MLIPHSLPPPPPSPGAESSSVTKHLFITPYSILPLLLPLFLIPLLFLLPLLQERNPPLAEALLSGDLDKFTRVLRDQQKEREEREVERIRMLNADPFDAAVQVMTMVVMMMLMMTMLLLMPMRMMSMKVR